MRQVATAVPDERSHAEPPCPGMCSYACPVRCREPSGFLPRVGGRVLLTAMASSAGKQMTTYRTV